MVRRQSQDRGILIITIDGPAGSGKSTVARELARRLGYRYLNTGAMYRAVGRACLQQGVAFEDHDAVAQAANSIEFTMSADPVLPHLLVNGEDLGDKLFEPEVSQAASKVAAIQGVRAVLVQAQRNIAAGGDWVAEGRDQGTVVFHDSPCKIFLDASLEVRAQRRAKQSAGEDAQALAERDARDAGREVDPLKPATDAVVVDTSDLGMAQVVERCIAIHSERTPPTQE
jgi:cytidylate kinase